MEDYDLRQLPPQGADIDTALTTEWLDAQLVADAPRGEPHMQILADGHANLRLDRIDHDESGQEPTVRLHGKITASLSMECVRCLEDVACPVDLKIDQTFFPKSALPTADTDDEPAPKGKKRKKKGKKPEQKAIDVATIDDGHYEGNLLPMSEIVREALLLDLPMNPHCADEDACQARTTKMIEAAGAAPEKDAIDPRWEALKKIQLKSE